MELTLKIFRFNPKLDTVPYYDIFKIEANPNDRILDCLNMIRWKLDSSLAYRMSCGHGICGSDGMTINGVSALACQKLVRDYVHADEIVIEPLQFFPIIKDLIVDMTPFFQRIKAIHPISRETVSKEMKERRQTIEERVQFDDAIKCIMCACCTASCPVILKEEPTFIGPAAVLHAQRHIFDSRIKSILDWIEMLEKPNGIWKCKTHFKCTEVCPKKIKITEAILQTKKKLRSKA